MKTHLSFDTLMGGGGPSQDEFTIRGGDHRGRGLWRSQLCRKRNAFLFARCKVDHYRMIDERGNRFPRVSNVADLIGCRRGGVLQVEFAIIVGVVLVARKVEMQIAYRLEFLSVRLL